MSKFVEMIWTYCNSLDITLGWQLVHVAPQKKIMSCCWKGFGTLFSVLHPSFLDLKNEESLQDSVFCWGVCLSFVDLSYLLKQVPIFNPVLISTGICETSDSYQSFSNLPAAYKILNGNCGIDQNLLLMLLQDYTSICSLKKPLPFHAYLEV